MGGQRKLGLRTRGSSCRGRSPGDECAEGDRERPEGDEAKGDRLKAGISEVLDGGQQVIVLFSVVNTSKHTILLMPPQVQLGGKEQIGEGYQA